jgi:hypothetical protein
MFRSGVGVAFTGVFSVADSVGCLAPLQADTVLFDDELSPGQLRNLEKAFSGGQGGKQVSKGDSE